MTIWKNVYGRLPRNTLSLYQKIAACPVGCVIVLTVSITPLYVLVGTVMVKSCTLNLIRMAVLSNSLLSLPVHAI